MSASKFLVAFASFCYFRDPPRVKRLVSITYRFTVSERADAGIDEKPKENGRGILCNLFLIADRSDDGVEIWERKYPQFLSSFLCRGVSSR